MNKSNRARKTLVLNKSYFPIRIEQWKQVFVNMAKGAYLGLDLEYETDDDGCILKDENERPVVTSMLTVKSFDDWCELPIRPYDDYVLTVRDAVRLPTIVSCANYNQIRYPRVLFPTNRNIFKRDNHTCCYTGKKLAREELSVDHIMPRSRGGKNTWENMVTCDRQLNCEKADRTPEEAGLKLRIKPTRPENGLVFDVLRDEWKMFVDTLK
jgi:5-methylcytosine-specific restriction endonuclease McrA